jgi:N-acetylmuramoyl-L-alanine amidase
MLLGLAGCVTDASRRASVPPEWQNPEFSTAPAPATPEPAAPPVPAPTPVAPTPAPPSPAAPTNEVTETWVPLYRWCKANGINPPCSLGQTPAPGYALSTSNGVFALRIGMQSGSWEGMEVRLGFAPQMLEGQPVVHRLDLKKTLRPLLCGAALSFTKTNPTIVIDPGHGGDDAGTRSIVGNRCEREFTLDWARRLEAMLKTNGWQVFLTRSNDTHLSLSNRIAFADEHRADVFLSLHFNSAAPNLREAGLETYCLTPTGMASSVTRGYSDDARLAFPNNAFDAENLLLAACVHRALLQVNGRHDRGVRHARYLSVLRGQNRPAILVEGGYLSNPLEARRIADPAYRERLAEAVANALNEKTRSRAPKLEPAATEPVAASKLAEVSRPRPAVNSTNQLH